MPSEQLLERIEERLARLEGSFAARFGPVVDPPPWGGGGWGHPRWPIPNPVVDPVPWGGGGGWVVPRWPVPNPVVDPVPWGGALGAGTINFIPPVGPIGDPPPFDLGRLNLSQLESALHSVNAEKARLDSMEKLVKDQIAKLKKDQKG